MGRARIFVSYKMIGLNAGGKCSEPLLRKLLHMDDRYSIVSIDPNDGLQHLEVVLEGSQIPAPDVEKGKAVVDGNWFIREVPNQIPNGWLEV